MTHLNWIRSKADTSPLFASQVNGLTLLCLLGIVAYFAVSFALQDRSAATHIPMTDPSAGAVAVEVSGETKRRGTYYPSPDTSLASFLESLDISPQSLPAALANKPVEKGMKIIVNRDGRPEIGDMASATRLALGLPLDVNKAAMEDLILIPGIKEATATKILDFRRSAGGRINRLEDLMQISGIKEKRLAKLRPYLFVDDGPAGRGSRSRKIR